MNRTTLFALLTLCALAYATVRAQGYSDVLVVVNSNSTISQDVATYFKAQRSIPTQNICSIWMPTTEEIDSTTYAGILQQIKVYMQSNSLTTSIKYIVTTQGVPLKVRRSSGVFSLQSNAGSFDSDLCLLNSSLEAQIGKNGPVSNPYGFANAHFTRSSTYSNVYLVTRLAGYSYSDIVGLIDRARQPYKSAGTFVFDLDITRGSALLNQNMITARNVLRNRGYNTYLDSTTTFVTNQTNVLGYVSWGSNDANWSSYTSEAKPCFNWSAKALGDTYVSSSGRSFEDSTFVEPTIGWQSMVADLIHEQGVTGTKGYVWEPYSGAMTRVDYLYERWTNAQSYNLAETYYMASAYMGWMDVIIGDPKATFAGDGHMPVELVSFSGALRGGEIVLSWKTATESNNHGFDVQKRVGGVWKSLGFVQGMGTVSTPQYYRFNDRDVRGDNTYRLMQIDRDGTVSSSAVINVAGQVQNGFVLTQNYPNPCINTTSVAYTLPEEGAVSISVYSVTGQEIARLVPGETRGTGTHVAFWNGTDLSGAPVAAGRYIYRMQVTRGENQVFSDSKILTIVR